MKSYIKYVGTLIVIVTVLLIIMVIENKMITRNKVEKNIEASISTLKSKTEVKRIKIDNENTYLHVYADEILLNIIYCIDSEKPLESIMSSKYYEENERPNLERAMEEKSYGNMQYMRYWHGSTIVIRPLLMFFNISQIYYVFVVILIILLTILFIVLAKKKMYLLIFSLIIGLIMTTSQYVPFCLEYVWTYLIMFLATIVGIFLEKRKDGNKKINLLMFIIGIMTCFFDFLSTETLTFTIPIIIIFIIRNKEERIKEIKTEIKQVALWMILWFIGYASMWGVKWLLSAIILNVNSLEYVIDNALMRVVNIQEKTPIYKKMLKSLIRNITQLYPSVLFKYPIINICTLIGIIISIVILKKQNKKEILKALIILGIGTIPYLRYVILSQHSYSHFFFTFRAQLVTIIAIIYAISIVIDKNKFKKDVKILKKENRKWKII